MPDDDDELVRNTVLGWVDGDVLQVGHLHGDIHVGAPRQEHAEQDVADHGPEPEVLCELPAPHRPFVGRDVDVLAVRAVLRPRATTFVAVIAGQAGVGKTATALEAAHEARRKGWCQGALFVNLKDDERGVHVEPHVVLGKLLEKLGVPKNEIPSRQRERESLYQSELWGLAGWRKRLLFLLDNAVSVEQVAPLLPDGDWHRVLVTSQETLATLSGARLVDLPVLHSRDSVRLLEQVLLVKRPGDQRVHDHAAFATVAEHCGHLPLALMIAAALLADNVDLPVATLATRLADDANRLDELRLANLDLASFAHAYELLTADEQRLFRRLSLHPGPWITTAAAAALTGKGEAETGSCLQTLRRRHLVEQAESVESVRMHSLLALHARRLVSDGEATEAIAGLLTYYRVEVEKADRALRSEDKATGERAVRWLDGERVCIGKVIDLPYDKKRCSDVIDLVLRLGYFFKLCNRNEEWVRVTGIALRCARYVAARKADVLVQLGDALRHSHDDVGAFRRYDEARALYESSKDDAGVERATDGLMAVLGDGPLAAVEHYRAIVRLCSDRGDNVRLAVTLENLGRRLEREGGLKEAAKCYRDAYLLYEKTGNFPGENRAMLHQAHVLVAQGEPAKAIRTYEAVFYRAGSFDIRNREIARYNVGQLHLTAGRALKARAWWQGRVDNRSAPAMPMSYPVRRWKNKAQLGRALKIPTFVAIPVMGAAAVPAWWDDVSSETVEAADTLAPDIIGGEADESPERSSYDHHHASYDHHHDTYDDHYYDDDYGRY